MSTNIKSTDWVDVEMKDVDLGDKRLNKRSIRVLKGLSENPLATIPESSKNWSEVVGAYRFLDNEKITHDKVLEPHILSTIERMKNHKIVLAIQDSTSLNYNGLKNTTSGLGEIGASKTSKSNGLMMHNTYAVSGNGEPLGTLDSFIWDRKTSKYKTPQKRIKTPISKKESRKWTEALDRVTETTKNIAETKIIHLMDREGDIYDVFSDALDLKQDFIIRVQHNRRVNKSSRGSSDGQLLSVALANAKVLGIVDLEINSRKESSQKRTATVEIKAVKVKIPAPRGKSAKDHNFNHNELEQTVVWIREINQEDDIEPVDWKLVTNVEMSSADDVLVCVDYYCKRWNIEVFFRVLKTGCRVEECRFSTAKQIKAFIALLIIVAWHIHRITLLARTNPKEDPSLCFTKREQDLLSKLVMKTKALKRYCLRDYVFMLARLGGFLNRKSDGMPGSEVLWRGWIKLKNLIHCLSTLEELGEKK